MCLSFTYGAKLAVLKEKEKNTRKHTATKHRRIHVNTPLQIRFVAVCLRVFFSFSFNTVSFAP